MLTQHQAHTVFGKYPQKYEKPESYEKWLEGCIGSDQWFEAKRRAAEQKREKTGGIIRRLLRRLFS